MFEGKTFFPVTGIPIRKMACMRSPLALADPVPFTVAILNAKSFTRSPGSRGAGAPARTGAEVMPPGRVLMRRG
jgi:hypothetical protein